MSLGIMGRADWQRSSILIVGLLTGIPLLTNTVHLPNAVEADLRSPKARLSAHRHRPIIQFSYHLVSLSELAHLPV